MKKNKKKKLNIFSKINLGEERNYFIENLAMLVNAGVGITESLGIITSGIRSKKIRRIILDVKNEVEQGAPLWQALKEAGIFSASTITLIKIGEKSGQLGANLNAIAVQQQKDRVALSRIQSAMAYPILVLSVTLIVAIGIFWFILPKLIPVFTELNVQLPLITKIFIAFSSFLVNYGLIFIPALLFFIILVSYFIFYNQQTKFIGQAFLFSIPGIKKLMREIEISRFGYILGNLLSAGVSLNDSLSVLYDSTNLENYKKLYGSIRKHVEEGNSLQKSFLLFHNTNKMIPSTIVQMIVVGEQSGNLSGVLKNIGEAFENKSDNTIKNLTVALEPILLIFVWFGVMAVALSIIMPIYSLIGGMNKEIAPSIPVTNVIVR